MTDEYFWPPKRPHQMDRIEQKLNQLLQAQGVVMADVTALNEVIAELETDEVAAVDEFKALSEEVAQLSTDRAPTQEQVDQITAKVKAVAEALKSGTPAPPPVKTPPVTTETPPATTEPPATPPASTETPPPAA